jgi:hypothetical protein
MTDIIFGRQLEHNRQLLWTAPGPLPDLGGAESDIYKSDHIFVNRIISIDSALSEPLTTQVISVEGVYRTVCIEFEIFGFAVASIMGSSLLDAQGITTIPTVQTAGSLDPVSYVSHDAACARAFK